MPEGADFEAVMPASADTTLVPDERLPSASMTARGNGCSVGELNMTSDGRPGTWGKPELTAAKLHAPHGLPLRSSGRSLLQLVLTDT